MKLTKEEALKKIEELKAYVKEKGTKEAKKGVVIYDEDGDVVFESKADSIKGAVEEAVEVGANLREANLRGANLWGANLREADLREANLREANLRGANLWGANLQEANLWGANLREANLQGANLRKADLRKADLWGANLQEANLWEADLREAELCNARFYGKSGTVRLKKDQVKDFLAALGFIVEE